MPPNFFKYVFLAGLVAAEIIRFPHRMRNKRARRERTIDVVRARPFDVALDMLAFLGMEVVPLFYVFSPWLDFADVVEGPQLPIFGWAGALTFAVALLLLWRAHIDLGRNWSPSIEVTRGQSLVTNGIYRYIRHPIYAAMWLWGIAQALLLPNWIAGLAGLAGFLPVYLVRVPREEEMMLEHFGEPYRAYIGRTGRIFPRLRR